MKISIKVFIFLCFVCNIQLFPSVCVSFPKDRLYFSKNVFRAGINRVKALLFLTNSYLQKQVLSSFDFDEGVKTNSNDRVEVQSAFHKQLNRYKNLLNDLDELQKHVDAQLLEINFRCFESLIGKLCDMTGLLMRCRDLKLSFDDYEILKEDTLKSMQSEELFFISFKDYCTLIDEFFDVNDAMIKQKMNLPSQAFLFELCKKNQEALFKFGLLEQQEGKQSEISDDYLSVVFKI